MEGWINKPQQVFYWNMSSAAIKRSQLLIHLTTWMNLKCTVLSRKKPDSKGYILHDSIYMTFWKRQKCIDINETSSFQGSGVRGEADTATGGVSGVMELF